MPVDSIPLTEYASRRKKLRTALQGATGLVFAGDHDPHGDAPFRPNADFEYLTGVTDEPGAVLLLDASHPIEARRDMLFLPPLNPEMEKWDGLRLEIASALRERTGFKTIFRLNLLPRMLNETARRSKKLACLHPPAQYNQPLTPDLEVLQKVTQRIVGVSIEDRTDELSKMRAVKSAKEIALIQRAVDITTTGFEAAVRTIKPGLNEFDVQEAIEHAYKTNGARSTAYGTIVGGGINGTVLHYRANDQVLKDGDLVCIDSGSMFAGYASDITRTYPVNGKFTKRQKEVYNVVLKAEQATIRAVKPGATLAQLDKVARDIITKAGLGDYFIHSIGHHLGLQTHDANPNQPLKAGAVVTIEPGVYIPDQKLGVRIEDDIVVTKTGYRNLSTKIPKSVSDIEKLMTHH